MIDASGSKQNFLHTLSSSSDVFVNTHLFSLNGGSQESKFVLNLRDDYTSLFFLDQKEGVSARFCHVSQDPCDEQNVSVNERKITNKPGS
mmetsp:Transcript_6093/g.9266  ORF Transcript_6093/g.9266 Transcript_6093/m.9266 type:complete len:90 (-) Transcript_6093:234-503(-)